MPEKLKLRVASIAERAGKTPHGFILEAIILKAYEAERAQDFHATAGRRYAAIATSGKTISWNAMRGSLEKKIDGKPAKRPVARKLAR